MRARTLLLAAACAAGLVAGVLPGTVAGFSATVDHPSSAASTAPWFTCAGVGDDMAAAQPVFRWTLLETGSTAVDRSGNGNAGTYTGAHAQTANSGPGGCPRDGSAVYRLNGTSSFVTSGAIGRMPPANFSLVVWFSTTTPGGDLMSVCNGVNSSCGQRDDRLYLDAAGRLVFAVADSTLPSARLWSLTSAAGLVDGEWHLAVATLGAAGSASPGMRLFVDGTDVTAAATFGGPAGSTAAAMTQTRDTATYWHVGAADGSNWPGWAATYFSGRITHAAAYRSVLSEARIRQVRDAGR